MEIRVPKPQIQIKTKAARATLIRIISAAVASPQDKGTRVAHQAHTLTINAAEVLVDCWLKGRAIALSFSRLIKEKPPMGGFSL